MLDYISADDPWRVRFAYRVGRCFNTPCRKLLGYIVLFWLLWLVFSVASTYVGAVFGADETIIIEHSAHFSYAPEDARAYTWLTRRGNGSYHVETEVNGSVSDTVITARVAMQYGRNIVLLRNVTCDASPVDRMPCADFSALPSSKMTPRQAEIVRMQYQACRYLLNNLWTPCVCAPMLGFNYHYIALRVSPVENDGDACMHLFNPEDQYRRHYNALDAPALKELDVGLFLKTEHENYRYNETRGVYRVLRYTRMAIDFETKQCKHALFAVHTQRHPVVVAQCLQYCLDKLDGIDVRERARMQYKQGVVLNNDYFDRVPDRPSCVFTPSPNNAAQPPPPPQVSHDEL